MKREYNIGGLMRLSHEQGGKMMKRTSDGVISPETCGSTAFCCDLRSDENGVLHGTGIPVSTGTLKGEYLTTDVRDSIRYVFMRGEGCRIVLAGKVDAEGGYTPLNREVCICESEPCEGVSAGSFLIFRLADGSLYYLMYEWDMESYTVLGTLPSLPSITVESTGKEQIEGTIAGVKFKSTVADMRGGVPAEQASQIGKSVSACMSEIENKCVASRRYLTPPAVRVGLRLWDGRLMLLSDKKVCAESYPGQERFSIPTVAGSGGCIGTEDATGWMNGYFLRVRMGDPAPGEWKSVIRRIEVYATRQQKVWSEASPEVTYGRETGNIYARFPLRGSVSHNEERSREPYYLAATADAGALDCIVKVPDGLTLLEEDDIPAGVPEMKWDCLCGHDGFIHAGSGDIVHTFSYGNPLVIVSRTACGGKIRNMAALPRSGGAYTRQYLYLFTSSGIQALTYDGAGVHRNCRTICVERVSDAKRICGSEEGIWCMSDSGTLLLLCENRVRAELKRMRGCGGIGCDSRRGEVWLFPEEGGDNWGGSVVLQRDAGERAGYVRKLAPVRSLPGPGVFVCLLPHPRNKGVYVMCIPDPESAVSGTITSGSRWVGELPDMREGILRLSFGIGGEERNADYSVSVSMRRPSSGLQTGWYEDNVRLLGGRTGDWAGMPYHYPEMLLQIPGLSPVAGTGTLTAEIRGRIPEFRGVRGEMRR